MTNNRRYFRKMMAFICTTTMCFSTIGVVPAKERVEDNTQSYLVMTGGVEEITMTLIPESGTTTKEPKVAAKAINKPGTTKIVQTRGTMLDGTELSDEFYFYRNTLSSTKKKVYDEIRAGLEDGDTRINLSTSISKDAILDIYTAVMYDNPEFFWCDNGFRCSYDTLTGYAKYILPQYNDLLVSKTAVEYQIDVDLAHAFDAMRTLDTEIAVVKYAHDYLVHTIDYVSTVEYNQTIYSSIINKQSVCAGYAHAFQYILQKMGIPCAYIAGYAQGENHAWNILKLDGEYYAMDVTWDDPILVDAYGNYYYDATFYRYDYFNLTDAEMVALYHYRDEMSDALPTATGTAYSYQNYYHGDAYGTDFDARGGQTEETVASETTTVEQTEEVVATDTTEVVTVEETTEELKEMERTTEELVETESITEEDIAPETESTTEEDVAPETESTTEEDVAPERESTTEQSVIEQTDGDMESESTQANVAPETTAADIVTEPLAEVEITSEQIPWMTQEVNDDTMAPWVTQEQESTSQVTEETAAEQEITVPIVETTENVPTIPRTLAAPTGLSYVSGYTFQWNGVETAFYYEVYLNDICVGVTVQPMYTFTDDDFSVAGRYVIGIVAVGIAARSEMTTATIILEEVEETTDTWEETTVQPEGTTAVATKNWWEESTTTSVTKNWWEETTVQPESTTTSATKNWWEETTAAPESATASVTKNWWNDSKESAVIDIPEKTTELLNVDAPQETSPEVVETTEQRVEETTVAETTEQRVEETTVVDDTTIAAETTTTVATQETSTDTTMAQPETTQVPNDTRSEVTAPDMTEDNQVVETTIQVKVGKARISSAKNNKKKSITLIWKKVKNAKKYVIQYTMDKKFQKSVKTKKTDKLQLALKGLNKNKTYYVRIRAIRGDVKGSWSTVKKVKVNK